MRRIGRVLAVVAVLLAAGAVAFGAWLSHDAPCGSAVTVAAGTPTMRAVVRRCYGSADVLAVEDVARPVPADDQVLVKVRAAALNPLDWHYMTGTPYVMRLEAGVGRPKSDRLGVDFAGTVAAVGRDVTAFRVGDEVYGSRWGAFAEYVAVPQGKALVAKPPGLSFAQAAGIPVAAITALQGLRDKAQLRPGQRVLVNGASGGVGTYAVQIAKALGAEVTGVCSTRNVELVRSLGADHVIDYTQEDFTSGGPRYDVVLDAVGNHSLRDVRKALAPGGVHVIIGGPKDDPWFGGVLGFLMAPLASRFASQRAVMLLAEMKADDLLVLNEFIASGSVATAIDRHYPLSEAPEAMRYLETRRARGKVILDVAGEDGR